MAVDDKRWMAGINQLLRSQKLSRSCYSHLVVPSFQVFRWNGIWVDDMLLFQSDLSAGDNAAAQADLANVRLDMTKVLRYEKQAAAGGHYCKR
jgi:hypothetical protein